MPRRRRLRPEYYRLSDEPTQDAYNEGYEDGYRDGAMNVKMYYSMKSESPPIEWLRTNQGNLLDTREKLLASLNK